MNNQANIREEELKNRVAALYFGKFDCTRIVGNIDFCVSPKRRDPRQMTFIPDAPIRSVASIAMLVILGGIDGTCGPNRFGADPKGRKALCDVGMEAAE